MFVAAYLEAVFAAASGATLPIGVYPLRDPLADLDGSALANLAHRRQALVGRLRPIRRRSAVSWHKPSHSTCTDTAAWRPSVGRIRRRRG